jgi:DNA-directed RNA polymerase specialized sigma24 family protein
MLADHAVRNAIKTFMGHGRTIWESFRLSNDGVNLYSLKLYLNACVIRTSCEMLSRRTREEPHSHPGGFVDPSDESQTREDLTTIIRDALFELSTDEYCLIYMVYYLKLIDKEIANLLEITPSAVKTRRLRAVSRLGDILRRRNPGLRFPDDFV